MKPIGNHRQIESRITIESSHNWNLLISSPLPQKVPGGILQRRVDFLGNSDTMWLTLLSADEAMFPPFAWTLVPVFFKVNPFMSTHRNQSSWKSLWGKEDLMIFSSSFTLVLQNLGFLLHLWFYATFHNPLHFISSEQTSRLIHLIPSATLSHILATSKLNYCNVLHVRLPLKMVQKLQLVQNTSDRLVLGNMFLL